MRLDQYLSKIGIIKRRAIAKEMADSGLIRVNNQRGKPSKEVNVGDIIQIGGSRPVGIEIIMLPLGNIKKDDRERYYKKLS